MTEEEARQKWCPFARGVVVIKDKNGVQEAITPPHNRTGVKGEAEVSVTPMTLCLGSECMAWRNELGAKNYPDGTMDARLMPTGHGYCGLAGKP